MGIKGNEWRNEKRDEMKKKEIALEAIITLLEIQKEEYRIGTLKKEDYDRQLCELSMSIRNMGII